MTNKLKQWPVGHKAMGKPFGRYGLEYDKEGNLKNGFAHQKCIDDKGKEHQHRVSYEPNVSDEICSKRGLWNHASK